MGTISVSHYREVVERLKRLLRRAKKPYTTLVVGRINEAKLMNLPDLEAYVLVACPQASLFDDPTIIPPVVTPYELECALAEDGGERQWIGTRMPLDFNADILNPGEHCFCLCECCRVTRTDFRTGKLIGYSP